MTNLGLSKTIRLLTVTLLVLTVTSWAQQRPPIVEKLAKTYGLDSFGKIDAVRYTFNLTIPGVNLSRTWTWEPKTNQVTYEGKDKDGKPVKVTYRRSELSSQPDIVKIEVDPGFINDNYWFMLPFHVYWDTSATVTDQGMKKLPIRGGSAELVVVKYPNEGGYTPGDTWELYIGKDNRIQQMVYHRGGPKKPSLVMATWAGYKKAGPLLVSTEHRGTADGKPLHLWFTNVAVKLTGSDKWVNAQ
ncbi:MAG: hypothetical protein ACXVZV_09760 [Terriglobales bacterium]